MTKEDDLSGEWITRKGKIVKVKRLDNTYIRVDEIWDLNGNHLTDPSMDLMNKISGSDLDRKQKLLKKLGLNDNNFNK